MHQDLVLIDTILCETSHVSTKDFQETFGDLTKKIRGHFNIHMLIIKQCTRVS